MLFLIKNYLARFLALGALALLALPVHAADIVTYFHLDALGSPVAATDQQGNVVWREDYEPYGNRIKNEAAAQTNTHWYTGHPHDQSTGLTYMGARWYDPTLGRFMGIDPKDFTEANPHSFNRYAYGNNNPYSFVDPDGKLAFFHHFYITYNVSREMGMGFFSSTSLAWDTMMVDFRPGSQATDSASANQHIMSGVTSEGRYQTQSESMKSGYEKILTNIDSGNFPEAMHAAQDFPTKGHAGKEWRGFTLTPPAISCLLGCSDREYKSRSEEFRRSMRHLYDDTFPSASVREGAYENSIGIFGIRD